MSHGCHRCGCPNDCKCPDTLAQRAKDDAERLVKYPDLIFSYETKKHKAWTFFELAMMNTILREKALQSAWEWFRTGWESSEIRYLARAVDSES